MEEIPNNHLRRIKPCKYWDILPYQLFFSGFLNHQQYLIWKKNEVETLIFRNGLSVKPFNQKGHPKTQPRRELLKTSKKIQDARARELCGQLLNHRRRRLLWFDPFTNWSHEKKGALVGWGYFGGWNTTQVYRDYFINQCKDPVINQPGFNGK